VTTQRSPFERVAPESVPPEAFTLVEAVRDLVEATVMTDVDPAERGEIASLIEGLTKRLSARERDNAAWFMSHGDDKFEHLTQAGTGRLNPQALEGMWLTPDGDDAFVATPHPETGEVLARCMFTRQHVGPPGRVHGGSVATLLDHVVGFATAAVGKPGMTAGLDLRYKGATPYNVPLLVRARYTHSDGRKHFATGEIVADGEVTASALGVFINLPPWGASQ
jgi:acyl-coenzyme A thioesterase PaaI-like protein